MYKIKRFSTRTVQRLPRKEYDILKRFTAKIESLIDKIEDFDYDHMIEAQLESLDDLDAFMSDEMDEIVFTFGYSEDGDPVWLMYDFLNSEWHLSGFKDKKLGKSINFMTLKSVILDYIKADLSEAERMYRRDKDDMWMEYINWDKTLLDFIKRYNFV